jgi:choline dehydrogenase-like flavoprotein
VTPISFTERRAALALLEAMIPAGEGVPGGDEATLRRAEEVVDALSPALVGGWRAALRVLSAAAVATTGRPFYALDADAQEATLDRWSKDPVLRGPFGVLLLVFKLVHFDRPAVYARLGGALKVMPALDEPRWLQQVRRGEDLAVEEVVACDVVVVGTGAGGAVVGHALAAKGYAVAFVEEGDLHRRDAFDGSAVRAHQRFYRGAVAVGNAPMPVFMGRMVGGSTAINGGTCFRPPPWVLDRWCEALGTDDFAPTAMAQHFERVEAFLGVGPTEERYLGPLGGVFDRGCRALGWSHHRIRRNAPGCQASGFCDFGCRSDARRSTNVSYIPAALERSAALFTGLRAERVRVESGRATGLDAVTRAGVRVRFQARAVILAGGALPTATFLQQQGLCDASGQVGRNLSLHPSGGMSALFDEPIRGADHVPQGFAMDHFLREGFLVLGAQSDRNIAPIAFPLAGRRLTAAVAQLDHLATVGTLIADDRADAVVRYARDGNVLVTKNLNARDVARVHQAMVRAGEMFLAAGARRLYPVVTSTPVLERDDFHRFARTVPAPGDLPLLSYHPLGTCRMGRDPKTSVVDLDHQTHDVRRLFVVDGSTVGGPLGVNPQLTIMAIATRAAERIADVLG